MIAFANVSKSFGGVKVLDQMTLDMADNGITCLLGTSGCGKSTVLRVASGLEQPESGQVFLNPASCGVVFQDNRLLPWLTCAGNLSLALSREKRGELASVMLAKAMKDVALEPARVGALLPRELSGGMAQRVCIARALLREPAFLMMDEPFASLDAITRRDLQHMLRELVYRQGIACLFVTHDIEEAFAISQRILFMRNGGIVQSLDRKDFVAIQNRDKLLETISSQSAEGERHQDD